MSTIPTLTDAVELGTVGALRALRHAEGEHIGWTDLAYAFLVRFAGKHEHFISEDVSEASKAWGMIQPPTDRAWGAVYRRAREHGIIAMGGTGVSRRRHGSICPKWRSLIYRGAA